ncbi:SEL1-like repeat protein [Polynucleobacter difficilis]|uniref:sel1 repeat family protein n=1 Tax=Polynucleobacter difficilis TaxID=556054 RepID=UPI000D3BDFBE|nr:sel1 repeat family protein [Polynucleobacter difficilis]
MASRQFLKILQSARFGDVSAQHSLASAYLTGAFNTPIQPANSLVWLEKSYLSIKNQVVADISSGDTPDVFFSESLAPIFSLLSTIPLANTVGSPAFPFGWTLFWKLADASPSSDATSSPLSQSALNARWQLIQCLLSPEYADEQTRLRDWLASNDAGEIDLLPAADFASLQLVCKSYLQSLAETENSFTQAAKELLLRLQPKDETLSGLWSQWLASGKQEHLLEAAEMGLTIARLTLGLQLAQLDGVSDCDPVSNSNSREVDRGRSNASLKKAVYWLELAAKDGDRNAWFALGEIYRRPQFSGYSASESDRCFDRAADLGHAQAQFRKGANLWRKREKLDEKVKGLQASYWVWQSQQQGVHEAKDLLTKILESCPKPALNDWHDLALLAEQAINRHAEYKIEYEWLLLCHRLIIANQFQFSKAELLLAEIAQLQHEHCVVVDIRWELPKILPRLIQIETIGQRRALLAAGKVFAGNNGSELGAVPKSRDPIARNTDEYEDDLFNSREREGNLRQRRYRFDKVSQWLLDTFAKEAATTSSKKK